MIPTLHLPVEVPPWVRQGPAPSPHTHTCSLTGAPLWNVSPGHFGGALCPKVLTPRKTPSVPPCLLVPARARSRPLQHTQPLPQETVAVGQPLLLGNHV